MARIPSVDYGTRVDTDSSYPQGKAKNIVGATIGTGTPLEEKWVNDDWGFKQAILKQSFITPSGNSDTADLSQYLEGLKEIILNRTQSNKVKKFDTLTAARADTKIFAGDVLDVVEYHAGTGGGGLWQVYDIGSLPTPINGYNVVSSTGNPTLGLYLIQDGTLNVKQFGAKGDGVTDDTLPIETAMKYQQFANIFFPTGKYVVTRKLTVNDKYLHIAGEGVRVSEILYTGTDGLFEFKFSGAETGFYRVSGLLLNTNVASCGTAITIQATQASGVVGGVDSLHVDNVIADAIDLGYWTKGIHIINTGGVYVNSVSLRNNNSAIAQNDPATRGIHIDCTSGSINLIRALSMSNFYIQRFQRGIFTSTANTVESIYVNNGEIVGCNVGLFFTGGGSTNACSFVSVHIDPIQFALYSDSTLGLLRLDSCDFRGGDNGAPLSDYIGVRLNEGETITITGCHFSGNNDLDPSKQSIAIRLGATIRSIITGNTFRNFDQGILRPTNEEYRIGLNDFEFVNEEVDQNAPQNPTGLIESKLGIFGGDLDNLTSSTLNGRSFTTINDSAVNKPPVNCTGAICETLVFDTNAAYQMIFQTTSDDLYYRRKNGGVWGSWVIK